jgi:hypothetical protein
VAEEEPRRALGAGVDQAAELPRVVEKIVEAGAETARSLRATVTAQVDGDRAYPVLGERAHDVCVARAVIGVAGDDPEHRLQPASRHGGGKVERGTRPHAVGDVALVELDGHPGGPSSWFRGGSSERLKVHARRASVKRIR